MLSCCTGINVDVLTENEHFRHARSALASEGRCSMKGIVTDVLYFENLYGDMEMQVRVSCVAEERWIDLPELKVGDTVDVDIDNVREVDCG